MFKLKSLAILIFFTGKIKLFTGVFYKYTAEIKVIIY